MVVCQRNLFRADSNSTRTPIPEHQLLRSSNLCRDRKITKRWAIAISIVMNNDIVIRVTYYRFPDTPNVNHRQSWHDSYDSKSQYSTYLITAPVAQSGQFSSTTRTIALQAPLPSRWKQSQEGNLTWLAEIISQEMVRVDSGWQGSSSSRNTGRNSKSLKVARWVDGLENDFWLLFWLEGYGCFFIVLITCSVCWKLTCWLWDIDSKFRRASIRC